MTATMATHPPARLKSAALFALTTVGLISVVGWLLTFGFAGPRDAAAIRLSAIVAIVVQLVAFTITSLVSPRHLVAGWGAGSLLRILTLGIYALLAVKVLALPPVAALISLAAFFFVSTLLEPLFLKR